MRVFVRTSRLAIWSRRLGTFGVPLLGFAILLHVSGQISSTVFEVCLAIATGAGALAVLLAIAGYTRLWFSGDNGWGLASIGLAAGAACLLPAGVAAALIAAYPSTADISTDPRNPPELVFPRATPPDPIDPDRALNAFPSVLSRSYRIDPAALYDIARGIAEVRGWQIMRARPQSADLPGRLNALHKSLLGWPNEIALRIEAAPLGARVDVRGASTGAVPHDLGTNGRAVESFLLALDQAVANYLRQNVELVDAVPPETGEASPEAMP